MPEKIKIEIYRNSILCSGKLLKFKGWPKYFRTVFVEDLIFNLFADFLIVL
jgi:hypothetical protein